MWPQVLYTDENLFSFPVIQNSQNDQIWNYSKDSVPAERFTSFKEEKPA